LLAELHGVPQSRESALKARFQHFQKLGFPAETKTGRGKPASYTAAAILKIIVAFELAALRIPPEQAVEFLDALDWSEVGGHLSRVAKDLAEGLEGGTDRMRRSLQKGALLIFNPDGLDVLRDGQPLSDPTLAQPPWVAADDDDGIGELSDILYMGRRFSALNLTKLLIHAAFALEKIGGPDRMQFGRGLLAWLDSLAEADGIATPAIFDLTVPKGMLKK
jgi:hypothetical protein